MKKSKPDQIIEYLSPIFIFSYFFIHNIYIVFIGIAFSLYLINIDIFNRLKKLLAKKITLKKTDRESY